MSPPAPAHPPTAVFARPGPGPARRWLRVPALCVWAAAGTAWAADMADAPLMLKPSTQLQEALPPAARSDAPTFVWGERIGGETGVQTVVEGQAELRRHDTVLRADRLQLDHRTQDAQATGHVSILRNGNRYQGPELRLNLDTYEGFFSQPSYRLLQGDGQGQADRVDFRGEHLSVAHNATYSTCPAPGTGEAPDWWVRARELALDTTDDTGTATGGALYFKGVPVLASPYLSFPISDKRKSGLLPPTLNITNIGGVEVTLPYYWNIAPDTDATLYPTLMTKRGIDLGAELRYLRPDFSGQVNAAVMPSDRLTGTDRWGFTAQHQHAVNAAALGLEGTGLRLNFNRVSDDGYWRDFPRAFPSLTQRLLANDAVLSARRGEVGLSAGVYTWQTLQDAAAPIVAPYDRVPHLDLSWGRLAQRWGPVEGLDVSLNSQLTRFVTARSPSVTAVQADVNGTRWLGIAQVSRTWQTPGWYVRPKAQWHLSHYQTDRPLWDGRNAVSRAVPTLSLDAGAVFEREANQLGRALLQTLEPRAFYVRTPYRDQNFLPNYDSGAKDFNFGTAWSDNVFGGHDRIADTHALTLGVSSRLIDPATGVEAARFGIAQRLRFADQRVVLPGGTPVTDRVSDLLLGTTLNWGPSWAFDGSVQYNPDTRRSQRTTLVGRYHPERFHVLSAAYRLQRAGGLLPASEQVDVGWQWPLGGGPLGQAPLPAPQRWYGVGRLNYSLPERKVVDLVAGFEYDAGCWIGRVVLERLQRSTAASSQRVLFQLEFSGFTKIGSNPLQTLKDNVPRYQYLREQVQPASRFGRYE